MTLPCNTLYEFGRCRLDKQKRRLWRDGEAIPVTAKAMEMLVVLVDHQGDTVTKQHLMSTLWPNSFVEEANLPQHVFHLRKALGETAEDRNYIVTVPGKGYCFTAEVRKVASSNGNGTASEPPSPHANLEPFPQISVAATAADLPHAGKGWLWLTAMLVLGTCSAYAGWRFVHRTPSAARRIMLAVLPFENLTGDAAQDYFSDGLTEEMISQLGSLDRQHLGVIARTSVMRYQRNQDDAERAARELGVDYVLKGSVRRDAQTVRISAHLIQTRDHTDVWARQYDRELTSILALHREIAQEVADEIELTLGRRHERVSANSKPPAPSSYQAYDLYLKGRYFWNKRSVEGFQQAARYFQQAIDEDPNYAPPRAGLADTFALMSTWFLVPQNEYMPKARAAALKALQLDENLAEAHTSLALIAESYDYDWQTAEREYQRAIQIDPDYATAHQWYAESLSMQGRFDEAFAESEQARRIDPLSLIIATDHAAILYFSRQYDGAIQQLRAVVEMEPTLTRAYGLLISAEMQEGKLDEAEAHIERLRHYVGKDRWPAVFQSELDSRRGHKIEARAGFARVESGLRASQADEIPLLLLVDLGMGRIDETIGLLRQACSEHSIVPIGIKVDPDYDSLRSDPRFQELLGRIGLSK